MVPTYFVRLDEVPLLPNNKINKKALPKPDTSSYRTEYVKPRNELEARKKPHRLTPTQVYILDSSLFKPMNNTWNLPSMFRIPDKKDVKSLADAVNEVIRSTPICATRIYFDENCELRQQYMPGMCPAVEIEYVSDAEMEDIRNNIYVRTNAINICMLLAIARCTGKDDVMMHYTFHNRKERAGKTAVGGLYEVLPLGIRLGSYRSLAELFDDVRSQGIGNVKHGNHNWSDLLIPGRLNEEFFVTYETGMILNSADTLQRIGLEELTLPRDKTLASVNRFAAVILDASSAFNMIALYMSNVYSEETVQKYMRTYDAFLSALIAVDNPDEADVRTLMDGIDADMSGTTGSFSSEGISVMSLMQQKHYHRSNLDISR